jgi:hypothetical protein
LRRKKKNITHTKAVELSRKVSQFKRKRSTHISPLIIPLLLANQRRILIKLPMILTMAVHNR